MEFGFDLEQILEANKDGIAIIDGQRSLRKGPQHYAAGAKTHPHQKLLNELVDVAGDASASAQNLPTPVTCSIKFFGGEDRMFLLVEGFKAIGMLRIGTKKLFIRDEIGNIKEIEPLCVLDFYVHESYQRSGYGKFIFETMLDEERVEPNKIAYDRPSDKFLKFLKKHYGLESYVPQANNFVVFSNYFAHDKTYKTFVKDKVLPRGKATFPEKKTTSEPKYGFQNYSEPAPVSNGPDMGGMPSYKEAVSMRKQTEASAYPPQSMEEQKQSYYEAPSAGIEKVPESGGSKRVQFAEAPEYYSIPQEQYQAPIEDTKQSYEAPPPAEYTYNNYEGYSAPAGKNYMNPGIEKDQFDRRFNRTSSKFDTKETVGEVFAHPESDGPLDQIGESRGQHDKVEFDIKRTDQRIQDTEGELKKCQERINQLQLQSERLSKTSQGFHPKEKFLGEKQIYSNEKDVIKPEANRSGYNKRFGYATVYDNKFKSVAKDPTIIDNDRSSTLSNAGSKLLAQNPKMNVYQHQELLRTTPFGANVGGDSVYKKMTSSSAYGHFFKR